MNVAQGKALPGPLNEAEQASVSLAGIPRNPQVAYNLMREISHWSTSMNKSQLPEFKAPPVEATELDSATPWLPQELERIAKLRSLSTDWESSGAAPPNETAIRCALQALQSLSEIDFRPDYIDPSTDEGICISFHRQDRYADIECFNTGETLAVMSTRGGTPQIWEVPLATISTFTPSTSGPASGS